MMHRFHLKNLILLIFLSFSINSIGQYEDFKLWSSVSLQKNLIRGLDLEIDIENRLENNLKSRDQSFADIGLEYSFKNFSASFIYRFTNIKDRETGVRYGNRFTYQLGYAQELKRFELSIRARYQNHYENLNSSELGHIPSKHFRSRMKLLYNIKGIPIDPFFSYENFVQLNYNEPRLIDKERYSLGANYKINKDNTVGIVFHIQAQRNTSNPEKGYILGVNYSYDL